MTQMPDLDESPTATRQEAADILGVHIGTIDRYLADGTLTRIKLEAAPKGGVRVSRDELSRILAGSRAPGVATVDTNELTGSTGEDD
jgi:predicted site-specific integrase-resolvase